MNRVLSLVALPLALALACVASAPPARADATAQASSSTCISDAARAVLTTCPGGIAAPAAAKPPHATLPARAPEAARSNRPAGAPTVDLSGDGLRDPRAIALKQRGLALLVTELQQLESLVRSTGLTSHDRPMLLRRLAEDYVELEHAASRAMTVAAITSAQFRTSNPRLAGQWKATENARKTTMERARKAAIAAYTTIVTDYAGQPSPSFPATPPPAYASLDEACYYLAYEYEQAGDTASARRVYLDLITRTPASRYVASAYLAFGELFFTEAMGDPSRWDAARQAYLQVVSRPPPDNKAYGYAWYKLAYVFWNQGDLPHALSAFKKTIDSSQQFSSLPGAAKLADSARRDLVAVYALAGSPAEAYGFFVRVSGDAPASSAKTFAMMNDLGQSYLDTGHYPEAVALYRDLEAARRRQRPQLRVPIAHHRRRRSPCGPATGRRCSTPCRRASGPTPSSRRRVIPTRRRHAARTAPPPWRPRPRWRGTSRPWAPRPSAAPPTPLAMDLATRLYRQVLQTWERAGLREVRVPAPGPEGLAHRRLDRVRARRPALLPRALGRVRSRLRRRRRDRPEGARRGERGVRRGHLLPERVPRRAPRGERSARLG